MVLVWYHSRHQPTRDSPSGVPNRYAIGQVQDAGLIFLSRMATSIAMAIGAQELSQDETEDPDLR